MGKVRAQEPSVAKLRRLWKRVATDAFFEHWWPGMDDVVYEDEHAYAAVEYFLAALREGIVK